MLVTTHYLVKAKSGRRRRPDPLARQQTQPVVMQLFAMGGEHTQHVVCAQLSVHV